MTEHAEKARRFLALHQGDHPLLMPNPWDPGSARLLASLGFQALATTSAGFAATLGRLDGSVTREEAMAHAASMVQATELPVSADLENGFGDQPAEVFKIRAICAAVRSGFSRFNATANSSTVVSIRAPGCRVDGARASNPPAR